jgi:hypothetical protein
MQRAQGPRSGSSSAEDAAAAARAEAAELVAPLLQLVRAAKDAIGRLRYARCRELYERALAAAEDLPLPHDSLVLAFCLARVVDARTMFREDMLAAVKNATPMNATEMLSSAWRGDEHVLTLAQRSLALYHARWLAGTLFTLSPEELALSADSDICGAEDYISSAEAAVFYWPPLRTPEEMEARFHGIYGALRTVLEMDARPDLQLSLYAVAAVRRMLAGIGEDDAAGGGILIGLAASCGLSNAEMTALCTLTRENQHIGAEALGAGMSALRERATADVARHGLRRCALPSCGATEPHPKCYKLCGRCRGVAYCSAAHSVEDWKRHKREEGCRAAP